jgi:phosphomannomutase / phosphoglucomutase
MPNMQASPATTVPPSAPTAVVPGIFREYDIRGLVGPELTTDTAKAIGEGFAVFLADAGARGPIAVGRDNRPSGEELHAALVEGLMSSGVDVIDVGMVPTPTLYWALEKLPVAGGVQITASHNPAAYNGFKLCLGTDAIYGDDIQRVLSIIQTGRRLTDRGRGGIRQEAVLDRYIDDLVTHTGPLARPLSVVVDTMNGIGSIVLPRLLDRLRVHYRCLRCDSDGTFPHGQPDPSAAANLTGLIAAVKEQPVDAGIAIDGDADRVGVVDPAGEIVWGDRVLAIYARDVLAKPENKGKPIIFDVKCSMALDEAVRAAGGTPLMWKTGHSLIEAKMRETGAPLAGELSGHMYIADGYYGFDDAFYATARLLRIMAATGKGVDALLEGVPIYPSTPEIRIDCPDDVKFGIVDRAIAHFKESHDVIDVDGARVLYGDGWGLVRASNTQPALVLRFEAHTPEKLQAIRDDMAGWLRTQGVTI